MPLAGLADILPLLPPILEAQWAITTPPTSLSTCRIEGSNDATHGTVGWVPVPPEQVCPFALLGWRGDTNTLKVASRNWTMAEVHVFLAVAQAGTAPDMNYNLLAARWRDALLPVIYRNFSVPGSQYLSPDMGDVEWRVPEGKGSTVLTRDVWGVNFYGVDIVTMIRYATTIFP